MKKLSKQYYWELAIFCHDWHSGQWSRGYRLWCKLGANITPALAEELRQSEAYMWLESNYAKTV